MSIMKKLLSPLLLLCAAGLLSLSSPIDDSKLTPAEQEIVKAELPSYPLTTCLVSKRALDSGDGPFDLIVNGHLFRVCCPGCEGTARAKAEELRAAIAEDAACAEREGAVLALVHGNLPALLAKTLGRGVATETPAGRSSAAERSPRASESPGDVAGATSTSAAASLPVMDIASRLVLWFFSPNTPRVAHLCFREGMLDLLSDADVLIRACAADGSGGTTAAVTLLLQATEKALAHLFAPDAPATIDGGKKKDAYEGPSEEAQAALRMIGVSEDATYDEVTEAYQELCTKYKGETKRLIRLQAAKDIVLEDRLRQRMSGAFKSDIADRVGKNMDIGDNRKAQLQDIAVLTGATVVSEELGFKLEKVGLEALGQAKKVTVSRDDTLILDGGGEKADVDERCEMIRDGIARSDSDYDKEKMQERLAKLSGGVAVLKVGGASEVEVGDYVEVITHNDQVVRGIALSHGDSTKGGPIVISYEKTWDGRVKSASGQIHIKTEPDAKGRGGGMNEFVDFPVPRNSRLQVKRAKPGYQQQSLGL